MPVTTPSQFRLPDETLADLDYCASALGLSSRTEAVRVLARVTAANLRRADETGKPLALAGSTPKRGRKKTSE